MTKKHYTVVNGELVKCKWKPPKPLDEIEYDESLLDLPGSIELCKRMNALLKQTCPPAYFAECWYQTFLHYSSLNSSQITSNYDINTFLQCLPDKIHDILDKRHNSNQLYCGIYEAIQIFMPLVYLELGLSTRGKQFKVGNELTELNSDRLYKRFKATIKSYRRHLGSLHLHEKHSNFTERLQFSDMSKAKRNPLGISRGQYAFAVMVVTGFPPEMRRIAEFDCKMNLFGIKNGKPTKLVLHTLCCILNTLLIHYKDERVESRNRKAFCRNIVAQTMNSFSPKGLDGNPFYQIDERAVEYALSGK